MTSSGVPDTWPIRVLTQPELHEWRGDIDGHEQQRAKIAEQGWVPAHAARNPTRHRLLSLPTRVRARGGTVIRIVVNYVFWLGVVPLLAGAFYAGLYLVAVSK